MLQENKKKKQKYQRHRIKVYFFKSRFVLTQLKHSSAQNPPTVSRLPGQSALALTMSTERAPQLRARSAPSALPQARGRTARGRAADAAQRSHWPPPRQAARATRHRQHARMFLLFRYMNKQAFLGFCLNL